MPTKRTIITLVAGLSLLAIAALSNWHTSGRLQKTYALVAQSHQTRASLVRLLAAVQDVQMGKRGYVISGDQQFLVPFNFGVQQTEFHLNKLLQLTKDNASHQERLNALKPMLDQKLGQARDVVAMRESGNAEGAQREVASGKGQAMTDAIRLAIQDIDQAESAVLVQRSKAASKAGELNNFTVIFSSTLSFVFFAFAAYLLVFGRGRGAKSAKAEQPVFTPAKTAEPERPATPALNTATTTERAAAPASKPEKPKVSPAPQPAAKVTEQKRPVAQTSNTTQQSRPVQQTGHTTQQARPVPQTRNTTQQSRPVQPVQQPQPAAERKATPQTQPPFETSFRAKQPSKAVKTGTTVFERRPPSLNDIIEQAVHALQPAAQLQQINLGLQLASKLPEVRVDGSKITDILNNLLTNALKHVSFGGSILVTCSQPSDEVVHVSVIDNGIGIAPENWERVFEPRENNGSTGLCACRDFLRAHGCDLWVHSELGKGSTFTFSIVTAAAPAVPATVTPAAATAEAAAPATPAPAASAAVVDPAAEAEVEEIIQQLPWNKNKAA